MNAKRYKLLGYLVWNGGKWYVRRAYLRRMPSARKAAAAGGGALLLTVAGIALAIRARG
jgi:hypothetical protein